jgi:hypothetical protein
MLRFLWNHMYAIMVVLMVPEVVVKIANRKWLGAAFQVVLSILLIVCEFYEARKRRRRQGAKR